MVLVILSGSTAPLFLALVAGIIGEFSVDSRIDIA